MHFSQTRWKMLGWALLTIAAIFAGVYVNQVFAREQFEIYADDRHIKITGDFSTTADVIDAAGLRLNPQDKIEPALTAPADRDRAIYISRATRVVLIVDGRPQNLWTHGRDLQDFLLEQGIHVNDETQVIADGVAVGREDLDSIPLPDKVEIEYRVPVNIQDGQNSFSLFTSATIVAEVLVEAGLSIGQWDSLSVPLDSPVSAGLEILVRRARPVTIESDGRQISFHSTQSDILAILAEANVALIGKDYTIPEISQPITAGGVIQVIRVKEDFRIEDEQLPYDTSIQPTDSLELDQRALLVQGKPGIIRRRYLLRYENGRLVSEVPDGEWVAAEPVNEVIGYGTKIVVRTLETPQGAYDYWRKVRMRVTSYTASSSGKPPDHPAYGITASGTEAGNGVVAVDPKVVPFRSWVYVPDYGIAFVGDTGGGVKGRWIDLGYDEGKFTYWNGYVDVYYLTPVPPADKINYLLPQNLP